VTSTIHALVAFFVFIPFVWLLQSKTSTETVVGDNRIQLPSPSGHFPVGTKTYDWVDRSRHEKASKDPAQFRQIVVQVWYPTESEGGPTSPYVPRLNAYRQIWTGSAFELAKHTQTHSQLSRKPAPGVRFPVVLLSHGWQGTRSEYTSLAEDLASHGYAVFGVDHPYLGWVALPNGTVTEATEDQFNSPAEIMEYYGRDLQFAIKQITELNVSHGDKLLARRLDLSRIAAIGHSSGFSAVSTACRHDQRIKACINIDAPGFKAILLAGMQQPLLWIRLERAGPVPEGFLHTTNAMVYELEIKGANHGSPEDWDYLEAQSSQERETATRRLTLLRDYVEAFLGKALRDQDSALLIDSQTNAVQLTRHQPQ
jgi:pimeloyl-ACP methyl ester carboxylesterase